MDPQSNLNKKSPILGAISLKKLNKNLQKGFRKITRSKTKRLACRLVSSAEHDALLSTKACSCDDVYASYVDFTNGIHKSGNINS